MTKETAVGAALKAAVQTMSKKKQTEMIADYIYKKYDVFSRFKPLAIGIDKDLLAVLTQFDPTLVSRVLANHCRRPRYIKALARGGKRFGLDGKFKGEVTEEEQKIAQEHPCMQVKETPTTEAEEQSNNISASEEQQAINTP
ncbi:ProQ/FINO family protein [Neisseria sp. Ec49-e6-T10]|uniref:ProQ/FINO family protein n=1 Tax=Neisseria sp. Ec49-e6-T10 TaxID=3140744 RepID=UPI003EBB963A